MNDISMATVYRDGYGVPHIDAENYKDAVKAIGFCHCEDDFFSIQTLLLAGKQRSGHYDDWDGPYLDIVCAYFDIPLKAKSLKLSHEYNGLLQSYAEGLNLYASEHPKEVLDKTLFPLAPGDILVSQHLMEIIGVQLDKPYTFLKNTSEVALPGKDGSNAIAIGSRISKTGHCLLALSPHQTIEGPFSYYEIHITLKEEDIELHGFILPCTFTIFMGTNFNIAWGATASYPEMYSIYEVDVIKANGNTYFMLGGEQVKLTEWKYKNYTKLYGKVPFPIIKTMYVCKFGKVVKISNKYYLVDVPMAGKQYGFEQNYKLSLCKSCKEASALLQKTHYSYLDFVLIDSQDNMLFMHCSRERKRASQESYYENVLPQSYMREIESTDFWSADNIIKINNPDCSYIVSTNQSPFKVSDGVSLDINKYKGLLYFNENSRSVRAKQLIDEYKNVGVEELMNIQYDTKVILPVIRNIDFSAIYLLQRTKSSSLNDLIDELKKWDGFASLNSRGAAIFALLFHRYKKYYRYSKNPDVIRIASNDEIIDCLKWVNKHLSSHATLGDIQFLKRGQTKYPIAGVPDSLNTVRPYYENGKLLVEEASAFRMIVDLYNKSSYTCHPLGASSNEDDVNYTSQMFSFTNNKYRKLLDIQKYKNIKGYQL